MEVQSVLFKKDKYTKKKAEKWLKENDFKVKKVDTTPTLYRYRQLEPSLFHKDKYKIKSLEGSNTVLHDKTQYSEDYKLKEKAMESILKMVSISDMANLTNSED